MINCQKLNYNKVTENFVIVIVNVSTILSCKTEQFASTLLNEDLKNLKVYENLLGLL